MTVSLHGTTLLLDWWPNPNHVPLFVGVEKGFLKDFHIIKSFEPPQALPYLLAKRADIVMYYMPQFLWANPEGVKMIGALIKEPLQGIMIRKGAKGNVLGTHPSKLLSRFLKGFEKEAEIKEVQMDLQMALLMRKIDMAFGFYANIEGEQMRQVHVDWDFVNVREMGVPSYYELVFLSLSDQPEFLEGVAKSVAFCKKHPDEAFAIYARVNPDKSERTLKWEKRSWEKTLPLLAENGSIDARVVERFKRWLFEGDRHQPEPKRPLLQQSVRHESQHKDRGVSLPGA